MYIENVFVYRAWRTGMDKAFCEGFSILERGKKEHARQIYICIAWWKRLLLSYSNLVPVAAVPTSFINRSSVSFRMR